MSVLSHFSARELLELVAIGVWVTVLVLFGHLVSPAWRLRSQNRDLQAKVRDVRASKAPWVRRALAAEAQIEGLLARVDQLTDQLNARETP